MKTNLWKRAAALLMSGALAVSMFAASAGALSFQEWQAGREAAQPFVSDLNQVWNIDGDYKTRAIARYDALTALIQKYPDWAADAYYERANQAYRYFDVLADNSKVTAAEIVSDVDAVISMLEKDPSRYYTHGGEWNEAAVFLADAYALRADISLQLLHQQQAYIDFMQKAVDSREQYYINFFQHSDYNWGYSYTMMLENAIAKNQLEELRSWYASGAKDFQTLNGRVQVTGGVGDTTITVTEQLSDGSTATQTLDFYGQQAQQVLRGVNELVVVLPPHRAMSVHTVQKDASGAVKEDSTRSYSSLSQNIGSLQSFNMELPVPEAVKKFVARDEDGSLANRSVFYSIYRRNA